MTLSDAAPDTAPDTAPAGVSERIPLSLNQEWMCIFDQGDAEGAFGPRFNHVGGWRLYGELDLATLQAALDDVVARHEILRTAIVRDGDDRYQRVDGPCPVELTVQDLGGTGDDARGLRAEQLLNDLEVGTYSAHSLPLLRAVLGRFDERDSVLALIVHHIAADAWSVQLVLRDLLACYAARVRGTAPSLPEVCQYQDFARAQLAGYTEPKVTAAREYWRAKVAGAQITGLPTDWPRSARREKATSWHRFSISAEQTSATLKLSKDLRCTPFMVLLAVYELLLHKRTGVTDTVVSTFSPGRDESRFLDVVGPFFNFLPLRTDLAECGSFREVVERTRATCLEAYLYDIPFAWIMGESPELMRAWGEDNLAACAFQVTRSPVATDGEVVGGLRFSEVRRLLSQEVGAEIPDGALWTMEVDASGELIGSIGFNSNLWAASTMSEMVADFGQILRNAIADPDAPWHRLTS